MCAEFHTCIVKGTIPSHICRTTRNNKHVVLNYMPTDENIQLVLVSLILLLLFICYLPSSSLYSSSFSFESETSKESFSTGVEAPIPSARSWLASGLRYSGGIHYKKDVVISP